MRKTEPKGWYRLKKVGIWTRSGQVFEMVERAVEKAGLEAQLLKGAHPADFTLSPLDLLCITNSAAGWAGANAIGCKALLLPGSAGPLARGLSCTCAISFGTSPKDTLTISSLEGGQICLALQRELVTLDGAVVEEQEWVLPFPVGGDPMDYLAAAGVLLVLGGGEAVAALG